MERLAEQIVDWHNRHPLARRIAVSDVHTVGVVALPFVRAAAQGGGLVEPVLTDVVSAFDELAGAPPVSRGAVWVQRLTGWVGRLPGLLGRKPRTQWRAFSEKFLPGLSPARVERFALAHGFAEPPAAPESRPWRVIVIDEKVAAARSGWPFELYLMTAGIDVGKRRTRVLAGRGIPSEIAGRRLWDLRRVGAAAAVLALLIGLAAWWLWPHHAAEPAPEPAAAATAPAASAASASAPTQAPAAPASAPGEPASAASQPAPADAASAPGTAASAPPAAASEPDPDAPPPDIRPRLVERADGIQRPPLRSSKPAQAATDKPGKGQDKADEKGSGQAAPDATPGPAEPNLARLAKQPEKLVVALVGPPGSKAEAEALLKRMQAGLVGVHSSPQALQGDVIQTPDGWRATVWPFQTREQAQLINATLVARGLKTKAINF